MVGIPSMRTGWKGRCGLRPGSPMTKKILGLGHPDGSHASHLRQPSQLQLPPSDGTGKESVADGLSHWKFSERRSAELGQPNTMPRCSDKNLAYRTTGTNGEIGWSQYHGVTELVEQRPKHGLLSGRDLKERKANWPLPEDGRYMRDTRGLIIWTLLLASPSKSMLVMTLVLNKQPAATHASDSKS